jgi:hypothetical protein
MGFFNFLRFFFCFESVREPNFVTKNWQFCILDVNQKQVTGKLHVFVSFET